jgi:hypothetical protein
MNELASRLRAQPDGDLSLAVGGVALGVGAALAFSRMNDSWADFPLLLLLGVPCAVLFALALAPGGDGQQVGTKPDGRLSPWQTAFLLVALPLLAGSVVQLLAVFGKDNPGSGTFTWVLALTGLCAAVISVRLQSPGATVLATLLFAVAGLTAVNWIDSSAKLATYRDILLLEGILFLLAARSQWDSRHRHANLLVAVAGAALIGGASLGNTPQPGVAFPGLAAAGLKGKDGWELVLIGVSIGLLAFAAWQRHGGSAFVGLVGVYVFFLFTTEGSLSGWPLVLGVVTVVCLAWALVLRPSRHQPGGGAPAAPQPPPT